MRDRLGNISRATARQLQYARFSSCPIGLMALPLATAPGQATADRAGITRHLRFGRRKRHDRCISVT
jgi:hypothetical protein